MNGRSLLRLFLPVLAIAIASGPAGPVGCGTTEKTAPEVTTPSDTPAPSVSLAADPGGPYEAIADRSVTFSGLGSTTPDPPITSYRWDFGDGSGTVDAATPSHVYESGGRAGYETFTVTLTIIDSAGNSTTATTTCRVTYLY